MKTVKNSHQNHIIYSINPNEGLVSYLNRMFVRVGWAVLLIFLFMLIFYLKSESLPSFLVFISVSLLCIAEAIRMAYLERYLIKNIDIDIQGKSITILVRKYNTDFLYENLAIDELTINRRKLHIGQVMVPNHKIIIKKGDDVIVIQRGNLIWSSDVLREMGENILRLKTK